MNKSWYYIIFFVLLVALFFSSCKKDDEPQNAEWKDKSEAFFDNLASRSELFRIDAGSGRGSIYRKIVTSGEKNQLSPIYTDNVSVYYKGATLSGFDTSTGADTIVAGKEFDTSYNDRNCISPGVYKPTSFKLNEVIEGWWIALQEMKPGDKWQVYVPWQLGYKESGSGTAIPGYSALIFEIELVSIN